jgi:hypothetical protein
MPYVTKQPTSRPTMSANATIPGFSLSKKGPPHSKLSKLADCGFRERALDGVS